MAHDPDCWCRQYVSFVGEDDTPENVSRETIKPTFLAHETHPSDSYSQAVMVDTPHATIIYHCQACYDANRWVH